MDGALDIQNFRWVLNIGLGRAILHLREHDAAPCQAVILNACLHCTACDPQVEGMRAQYLLEVIQATRNPAYYQERIIQALRDAPPSQDWDHLQLMVFAKLFALEGDEQARRALYDAAARDARAGFADGATLLIDLDGLTGLSFLAGLCQSAVAL